MKKMYKLSAIILGLIFPVINLYSQALFIDAKDGTNMLNGTHGDFTITTDMTVATGAGACPMDGDIWSMDTNTKSIVVQYTGSGDVEKIELKGILLNATSSAVVLCNRKMDSDGSGSNISPLLTSPFTTTSGTCDLHTYENAAVGDLYPRYFRFTSTTNAGKNLPGIQSIAVYLKDNGIPSSISGTQNDKPGFYFSGNELNFTETVSRVFIYNISGQLMQMAENIQTLPLNTVPLGIYLVKATSCTGQSLITKIVR